MPEPAAAKRSGRRQRRARVVSGLEPTAAGIAGGLYRPLTPNAVERIHQAALQVLERIGMAEPTPTVRDLALEKGCTLHDGGRLLFPRGLIEDTLAGARRDFVLCGQKPEHDVEARAGQLYFATGGAAMKMLDSETGTGGGSDQFLADWMVGEASPYDLPIVDPARFAEDLDRAACLKRIRETYAAGYALPGSPADPPRPGEAGSQIQDLRRA